jgi:hypothetical protein
LLQGRDPVGDGPEGASVLAPLSMRSRFEPQHSDVLGLGLASAHGQFRSNGGHIDEGAAVFAAL